MADERDRPPRPPGDIYIEQREVAEGATGVAIHHYHYGDTRPPEAAGAYRCMVPAPAGFVRRRELDDLVELLCEIAQAEDHGSVGITTALQGAGGFGKTTLAQALCHDERVRAAFPGGILWTALGEELGSDGLTGRLLGLLRWWSGEEPPAFDTPTDAAAALAERLAGRGVLVVVDDVWKREHLAPFLSRGLSVLVTTRNRHILPHECRTTDVDSMQAGEAIALLGRGIGQVFASALGPLAERLGYWPLLLGLANGRLRTLVQKRLSVDSALNKVSEQLDKLGLKAFDEKNTQDRTRAVGITLRLSLDCLDEDERRCYERLAVFPEDVALPIAMLARYWWPEHTNEDAATDLCERLSDLSLVQHLDLVKGTVRLHDVFRQYLLDNQRDTLSALHAAWLDAFRPGSGRWSDMPVDATYAWQHLAYHLRHAGRTDELVDLLFDYAWFEAKLRPGWLPEWQGMVRVNALLSDFEHVPAQHMARRDADLVRDALRLSSHVLARGSALLPGQLIGRLAHFQRAPETPLARLLEQSRGPHAHAWLKPLVPSLTAPGALRQTLTGHVLGVRAVAVTADGKRAVSGSADGTLKVWDLESGQAVRTLSGHTQAVNAVGVTADGKRAVSGSEDGTLKVWDLESGQEEWTLSGHTRAVNAVGVTADGKRAVSGSADWTLKVWDLESGQQKRTLSGHTDWVMALAVTADGKRAVSGSADWTLKVWDLASGHEERPLSGHNDRVLAVGVTADGKRAVSGSSDGMLKVWDLESGREKRTLWEHTDQVMAVGVTADGKRAVSGSADETLKVWDLESGQAERTLWGQGDWVKAVGVTADGKRAISGLGGGTLQVWDLESGHEERPLLGHTDRVGAVAVTADGKRAISGSGDGTLKVWDLERGQEERNLLGHTDWGGPMAVTADGKRAVAGSDDGTLQVWNLESGQEERTLPGHRMGAKAVAVTADGKWAVSGSAHGTLKVWDLESGQAVRTLSGHTGAVMAVAVTADGKRAVSGSTGGTLKVWDLESGREERTLSGYEKGPTAMAVTADGKRAISGSGRGTLQVWDLESGREERFLAGHGGRVMAVAVTADGKRAVSGSSDGTLNVWDLQSGHCLATFAADAGMTACAIRDPSRFVAGDALGRVHFLRLVEAEG